MSKTKDAIGPGYVYLAEHIGDTGQWEWWNVYHPLKYNLIEIFEEYLTDFLGEETVIREGDLKVEGNYTIHKDHDFRVWKVNI